ncbi:histidine kinase [Rhodocytophaga aerolata]|uniref:Histidine kinase n=1 Tax=Rhodocytophaga aerolata TaxID=455078 RepID=A0ABT8R2R3_9BACT|nr:histidine kinase [Rhodocytophaga aerolata]MDO1445659.1 histidine kinase [Rhodocytophaga aerolata]
MEKLNDSRLWAWGMLIQNIIFFLFFYLQRILVDQQPAMLVIGWQLLFTWVMWMATRLAIRFSRSLYPGLKRIRARLLCLGAALVLSAIVIGSWHVWVEIWIKFWQPEEITLFSYLYSIGMTLFFCQLIAGIYEALYYLEHWKKSVSEREALEKKNLQSQLESLKNQVSPHFLFNSLNSLSGLVEEDPKRAVRFIEELSTIYRYLLQSNEKQLTSLRKELEFIEAYFYLLQTRFEEGLSLETDTAPGLNDYLLPPLTLQILIENAVKHNMISEAMPLHIRIYTDEAGNLIVSNNLQKRKHSVPSNKMGLVNISAKYQLLNQPDIIINKTSTHFQVIVPLISHKQDELSYSRR